MIAISFLGLGKYDKDLKSYYYDKVTYSYHDNKIETDHFPYAIYKFVNPDKFYVIMTKAAKEAHSDKLKKLCDFEEIIIPDGKTEDEFWIIFDKITSVIETNDKVVFDITHGFRSQPFIVIVLLLYLKALKDIEIVNILYGAYEAKDTNNVAPVFELKSFIDLIDWSNAVREFTENGNMKHFKLLLADIHKNTYLNKLPNPSKQLLGIGKDLELLTDAFNTIRLNEIFDTTLSMHMRLSELLVDLENHISARPFKNLISKITNKFESISLAENKAFSQQGMIAQKTIINWYLETNKYQKAITLAREYIISKYMIEVLQTNENFLLDKDCRIEATAELGELLNLSKSDIQIKNRKGEYAEIWTKITDSRNDINHAGMRKQQIGSGSIIKNIDIIINEINRNF